MMHSRRAKRGEHCRKCSGKFHQNEVVRFAGKYAYHAECDHTVKCK